MFRQASRFARAGVNLLARPISRPRNHLVIAILLALAVTATACAFYEPVKSDAAFAPVFPVAEVAKHNKLEDCWIAINGQVYDVSEFLQKHPGGAARILRYAGGDASSAFGRIHTPQVLKRMKEHVVYLGPLGEGEFFSGRTDPLGERNKAKPREATTAPELSVVTKLPEKPALLHVFNLQDFEYVARQVLPRATYGYFSTGALDEYSLRENHYAYLRVFFRPKALQNVAHVTTATTMLGIDSQLPLYISGFAGSNLAHPDAEYNLQRAAFREGIVQMVPLQLSLDPDEFFAQVPASQQQWQQIHFYLTEEMEDMDSYLRPLHERANIKGVFFNVDVSDLGNREKDSKVRVLDEEMAAELAECANNANPRYCRTFTWDHVRQLVLKTHLPVGLKGVQRGEDVVLAAEAGVKAVILSNHGGRQLDFSRPPLEVLSEARQMLKEKNLQDKIEIYVDGGIRRGLDVVKALCLGAKGVGLGRPFLYAMAGYGEEGVVRAIQILKQEVRNNMTLLGASSIADLDESFVDFSSLKFKNPMVNDRLYDGAYMPMMPPGASPGQV